MKKRLFSILLVFVLSLFFVGCGGNYVDEYTVKEDVKIEEVTEVQLADIQKEMVDELDQVKTLALTLKMHMDAGDEKNPLIGKQLMDIKGEIVFDVNDPKNPLAQMSLSLKVESGNETAKTKMTIDMNAYIKDMVLYMDMSNETYFNVNGQESSTKESEKVKMNLADLDLGGMIPPLAPDQGTQNQELPELPVDKAELEKAINELITELKKIPGVKIGTDSKGNLVIEGTVEEMGNAKARLVFVKGLPVYVGVCAKNSEIEGNKVNELLLESGIKCNSGKIKFPNFDDYKDVNGK